MRGFSFSWPRFRVGLFLFTILFVVLTVVPGALRGAVGVSLHPVDWSVREGSAGSVLGIVKLSVTDAASRLDAVSLSVSGGGVEAHSVGLFYLGGDVPGGSGTALEVTYTAPGTYALKTAQELGVGDHYFRVTGKTGCAADDEEITVTVSSVTLDGTAQPVTTSNSTTVKVKNLLEIDGSRADQGSYSVCNQWVYRSHAEAYKKSYDLESKEYSVTFTPGKADQLVVLTLKEGYKIDKSSEKLKVYAGSTADESHILHDSKNDNNYGSRPDVTLRGDPSVGDGAITVVFSSSNNKWRKSTGFLFEVGVSRVVPLRIKNLSVAHPAQLDTLYSKEPRREVLDIELEVEGDGNAVFGSLSFDVVGAGVIDSLIVVERVRRGRMSSSFDEKPRYLSSSVLAGMECSLTEDGKAGSAGLPSHRGGETVYFRVYVTLKDAASVPAGSEFDVSLKSYALNGKSASVENGVGSPVGKFPCRAAWPMVKDTKVEVTVAEGAAVVLMDDGGSKGKSSKQFKGDYLLKPGASNKRVALFFKESGFSQWGPDDFKIYDGEDGSGSPIAVAVVDKKRVLESGTTYSASQSTGSLFISFSTTYAQGDGFLAYAYLVDHSRMQVTGVTSESEAGVNVNEGGWSDPVLYVNVKAEGSQPALKATGLKLDFVGSSGLVDQVEVYRLGGLRRALGAGEVAAGTASVTGETQQVELTDVTLSEGNNWFAVRLKAKSCLAVETQLKVQATGIVVEGGSEVATSGEVQGVAQVKNQFFSEQEKKKELVLCTEYELSPTMTSSGKYEVGMKDETIVVKPNEPGHVTQLIFDAFDVRYSSSSYGVKASFKVYFGDNASSGNEVFEYTGQTPSLPFTLRGDANKGGGALTIVFNPQTDKSYYAGKGWRCTASSYLPKQMQVDGVESDRPAPYDVVSGQKGVSILRVNLKTSGTQDVIQVNGFTFTGEGHAALSKAELVYTAGLDAIGDAGDRVLMRLDGSPTAALGEELTFSLNDALRLREGDNWFWLRVDLREAGSLGGVKRVVTSPKSYGIVGGTAPVHIDASGLSGTYSIMNAYIMEKKALHEVVVSEPLYFFHPGYPGKLSETLNTQYVTHFKPADPSKVIEIAVKSYDKHAQLLLHLYNDAELTARIAKDSELEAAATSGSVFSGCAADGGVYAHFESKKSKMESDGWQLVVRQVDREFPSVRTLAVEGLASGKVTRGGSGFPLYVADVELKGHDGRYKPDALKLNLSGMAGVFSKLSVYLAYEQSGSAGGGSNPVVRYVPVLPALAELANPGTGEVSIGFPAEFEGFDKCSTSKFKLVVVGDVSSTVAAGSKSTVEFVSFDGVESFDGSHSQEVEVVDGLKGEYVVGESGDRKFASVIELKKALEGLGVSGPVTLRFKSRETSYGELRVERIPGSGKANPVVIESASGNREDVKFSGLALGESSHVTVRNVTVDGNNEKLVRVIGSDNVTLESMAIRGGSSTKHLVSLQTYSVNAGGDNFAPGRVDSLRVYNCEFTGSGSGIVLDGYLNVTLVNYIESVYAHIKGNRIELEGARSGAQSAVYSKMIKNLDIEGNVISITESSKLDLGVLRLDNTGEEDRVVIRNNRVEAISKGNSASMILFKGAHAREGVQIYNNVFSLRNSGARAYGIEFQPKGRGYNNPYYKNYKDYGKVLVAHNTFNISGTDAKNFVSACISLQDKNGYSGFEGGLRVENNIFSLESGVAFAAKKVAGLSEVRFTGNVYSGGSDVSCLLKEGESGYTRLALAGWSSGEDVTVTGDRGYIVTWSSSAGLLDNVGQFFQPKWDAGTQVALKGSSATAEVKTDIDGTERAGGEAWAGAYGYVVLEAPAMVSGYPKQVSLQSSGADVVLKSRAQANAYYLVRERSASEPEAAAVIAGGNQVALSKGLEGKVELRGLKDLTEYALDVVLKNDAGQTGVISFSFKTLARDIVVSTFENLTVGSVSPFLDGTQEFEGFSVYAHGFSVLEEEKRNLVGRLDGASGVFRVKTDPTGGARVPGFFVWSNDKNLTLTYHRAGGEERPVVLGASGKYWRYIQLKEYDDLLEVRFSRESTTSTVYIDEVGAGAAPLRIGAAVADRAVIRKGEEVALSVDVWGGVQPYEVTWLDMNEKPVGMGQSLRVRPEVGGYYGVTVKDSEGEKGVVVNPVGYPEMSGSDSTLPKSYDKQQVFVTVEEPLRVASFEDMGVAAGSRISGRETEVKDNHYRYFSSGTFALLNIGNGANRSWTSFGFSSEVETSWSGDWSTEDLRNILGKGAPDLVAEGEASKTWAVSFGHSLLRVVNNAQGVVIPGFYILPTAYTKSSALSGDSFIGDKFKTGDYQKVLITAKDKDGEWVKGTDGKKKEVEYYLFDYRSADTEDHYYLEEWSWRDLSVFGAVTEVHFETVSSRSNSAGTLFPNYFALDNVGIDRPVRRVAEQVVSGAVESVDLKPLTGVPGLKDSWNAKAAVSIVGDGTWAEGAAPTVDAAAGVLKFGAAPLGKNVVKEFLVEIGYKGRTEWLLVPVRLRDASVTDAKFLGVSVTGGEGVARVKGPDGSDLSADARLALGSHVMLVLEGKTGWEALAENVKVTGLKRVDGWKYEVVGDFNVSVRFTKVKHLFVSADVVAGVGTVEVRDGAGALLSGGQSRVEYGGEVSVKAVADGEQGWELKGDGLTVSGLELIEGSRYRVVGDFSVQVTFSRIAHKYLSVRVLSGDGSVEVRDKAGALLEAGKSLVDHGGRVIVKLVAESGWEARAENVELVGLKLIEGDEYEVVGDFSVSVKFTRKSVKLLSITVEGDGSVRVLDAQGGEVKVNETVLQTGARVHVKIEPGRDKVARAENVKLEGLKQIEGDEYEVTGDIRVSVKFTDDVVVLKSITVVGDGKVVVRAADGKELKEYGTVKRGSTVTVVVEPGEGSEAEPGSFHAEGLDALGDNRYVASGDISISVKFRKKEKPKYTVKGLTVLSGQGTVRLYDGVGSELKVGAVVEHGAVVELKVEALRGWRVEAKNVSVEGLKVIEGTRYEVTGDVTVSVTFTELERFRFIGVTVEGAGGVEVRNDAGTLLQKGAKVIVGSEVRVSVTASEGYEVEGEVVVDGLKHVEGDRYVVEGDFSVRVRFVAKSYRVVVVSSAGDGRVKLVRGDGSEVHGGEAVRYGESLRIVIDPGEGYTYGAEDVQVKGLVLVSGGEYVVSGDVEVRVVFRPGTSTPVLSESFAGLRVYPNPADDVVIAECAGIAFVWRLYNGMGVEVARGPGLGSVHRIDVSGLQSGIYILQVSGADGARGTVRVLKR